MKMMMTRRLTDAKNIQALTARPGRLVQPKVRPIKRPTMAGVRTVQKMMITLDQGWWRTLWMEERKGEEIWVTVFWISLPYGSWNEEKTLLLWGSVMIILISLLLTASQQIGEREPHDNLE